MRSLHRPCKIHESEILILLSYPTTWPINLKLNIIGIMNYYNPYFETSNPTAENSQYNKKYSLRRKFQNPLREQLHKSKNLKYQNILYSASSNQKSSDYQLFSQEGTVAANRIGEGGQRYDCMQTAQRIVDFNQTTSINIKNHTKTLSTTPSFQNPFLQRHMCTPQIKKSEQNAPNKLLTKKSHGSSKQDLHPSYSKSQKTAVSHKFSHNSSKNANQRLNTENNSQPLSTEGLYADTFSNSDKRGKISLKNTNKFTNQSKSELLICLKYSDLKQPIRKIGKPHHWTNRLQYPEGTQNNGFTKYICSTIKGTRGGCSCQPKCFWIDRWMSLLGEQTPTNSPYPIDPTQWDATLKQIQKDLPRTQPQNQTFQLPEYLGSLRQVLVGYAKMDWEVGYVQGMNFIAAALVYHSRSSFQALKIMEYLMREGGFRKILLKDLAMSHLVSKRCVYELKRLSFDLYNHFLTQDVQIEIFITSWYFSLMGNFVPLESMHLIIDKFLRSQFTGLNEIIIALLIYLKSTLFNLRDNQLMMAFSNQQITFTASKIDWEDLVARSDHLLLESSPY